MRMLFREYPLVSSLRWIVIAALYCCGDCCNVATGEEQFEPRETGILEITLMNPYFVKNDGRPPPVRHDGFMDRRTMEYNAYLQNVLETNAPPRCKSLNLSESRRFYGAKTGVVYRSMSVGINFPPNSLLVGDVIPVFGAVARVREIGITQQTKQEFMKLDVISESELPPGVLHPRLSHSIPLNGYAGMGQGETHVLAIEKMDGQTGLAAKIRVKYEAALPNGITQRTLPDRWVRENDVITIPGRTYETEYVVRGMVAPDKERRICGWLLVEPLRVSWNADKPKQDKGAG